MTAEVPLYEQDVVEFYEEEGPNLGEILELDIPHPDRVGSCVRVDSLTGQRLVTRQNIMHVYCPKCHPEPFRTYRKIQIGQARFLTLVTGAVTNMQTGVEEIRWFRYCPKCNYFKEATL